METNGKTNKGKKITNHRTYYYEIVIILIQ